mmetsp:Transcript_27549/g.66996  ORF Transcript_27549/g.66996 Transcript_27549/m.66996 type:complete len:757 (-) Transcript_27549:338-2608(-)
MASSSSSGRERAAALRAQIAAADRKLEALGLAGTAGGGEGEAGGPGKGQPTDPETVFRELERMLAERQKIEEGRLRAEEQTIPAFRNLAKKMDRAVAKASQKHNAQIRSTEKAIEQAFKAINKDRTPVYVCGHIEAVQRLSGISADSAMAAAAASGLRAFGSGRSRRGSRGFQVQYRGAPRRKLGPAARNAGAGAGGEQKSRSVLQKEKRDREQLDRGVKHVLDAFPYLTKEQCAAALKKQRLDITKTMTWMLSMDQMEMLGTLESLASAAKAREEEKKKRDLEESKTAGLPEFTEKGGIVQFLKDAREPALVYRVESVSEREGVRLRGAFDRNGVTLHPGYAPNFVLNLEDFFACEGTDFRILTREENQRVMRDIKARVLTIAYQSFSETDFSPISVTPKGVDLFTDYKVVYDERSKRLSRVLHRDDGAVLFSGEKDRGEFGLWDGEPIEIFTAVQSRETHRVVHIHLNDIREDITIDSINITGTDEVIDDMRSLLKKDTSGRMIAYKIVVRDEKVAAVLYHSGKTKRAKFVERPVPPVGSLVRIASGGLATVLWSPTGLVVSTKSDEDIEQRQKANFPVLRRVDGSSCLCGRKHPVELPGIIEVRLEKGVDGQVFPEHTEGASNKPSEGSQNDTKSTRFVSIPVCCVNIATVEEENELKKSRQQKIDLKKQTLVDSMVSLENLIKQAETGLSKRGETKTNIPDVTELETLRKKVSDLSSTPGFENVIDPKRIQAASRALRFIAFQKRSNRKSSQ